MMDRETELQLVDRLRAGDQRAFESIHNEFNDRLYNFLARLSNRRDIAEDLLEETWLRLVIHAGRLRPDTSLTSWLFTVARNLYVSYCRSRAIEDSYAPGMLGLWPAGRPEPSPLQAAEAGEMERRVAAALATLPALYREALLLIAVEGLQPSDAAAVCGVAPAAMRQRVSRARALLAERLTRATDRTPIRLVELPA
jgi:RNA polymerase sigma-70 factor (ECF subfamily)